MWLRTIGLNGWHGHDHELWQSIKKQAAERHYAALERPLPTFFAFDADWDAVQATRKNIIAAGFEAILDQIQIEERVLGDWCDFGLSENQTAFIVTNPPYGERLGDKASNRALYQGLSFLLQENFPNQSAAIIAAHVEQADVLAFEQPETLRLMNGNLPIYVRLGNIKPLNNQQPFLSTWQAQPVEVEGAQDFANRLQKNMQSLRKWANKESIHCLRLYDADLPDFNLVVDLYGDKMHVQEYAPPKSIDPEKAGERLTLPLQRFVL